MAGDEFVGFGQRGAALLEHSRPVPAIQSLAVEDRPPSAGVDSAAGWLVVAAALVVLTIVFGVTYSFAAFLTPISDEFGTGSGATAFLFGLTVFFLMVLGLPAGRASDRWGPRPVVIVGGLVLVSGLLAMSVADNIVIGYLAYGVLVGVGAACCYVPVVSQVSGWFDRHRTTALGVAVSGIGIGTLFGTPLANALIESNGWRETYRLFAVVTLAVVLAAAVFLRPAPAVASAAPISLAGLIASPVFRRLYTANFLLSLALFVPFALLKDYGVDKGISSGAAAALVSFLGFGSLGGRILLGAFAAQLGALRLYQVCFAVMAASYVIWLLAGDNYVALAAFGLLLGTAYGGYVALSPAVAAELFGVTGLGATLGALYTAVGVGALGGPLAAGWLRDATGEHTTNIAASLALSAAAAFLLRRVVTAR